MALTETDRFFFIHVMKTGGTSFAEHLRANFAPEQRYPDACITPNMGFFDGVEAYMHVPKLVSNVNNLEGKLRIVLGHVPYAVRFLLTNDYVAMTLLRNPIDRTISYLKHCRRYHIEHMSKTLEQIYEDTWFHASFISNYQTKLFSMSAQEALAENRFLAGPLQLPPRRELGDGQNLTPDIKALRDSAPGRFSLEMFATSTGVIEVDDARLTIAKENLSAVDVVGVTEHYDRFLQHLADQYGWEIRSIPHRHVGEVDVISPELRDRIARDTVFDMELYDYAKSIAV